MTSTSPQRTSRGVIALFVDRPVLTAMVTLALLLLGVVSFAKLPLRLTPEGMSASTINLWIPVRISMSPREVEERVAKPLEEQLRTVPGIASINCRCSDDTARFWIELETGFDPTLAAAELRDRAQRAKLEWPEGVDRYFTWREDGDSAPLAFFQLLTPERSSEWDHLIDTVVRTRLEAVDGVGRVEVWGLLDETLRIWFERDLLVAHNLNYGEIIRSLAEDNFTEPVGEVDNGAQRFLVRVDSKFRTEDEIRAFPIRTGLTIGDIARVERVPSVRDSLARFDGKYTYTGILRLSAGTNPVDASERVHAALADLGTDPRLTELETRFLFDQGEMIRESLETLLTTSVQGGVLALLALLLFTRNLRATLVIAFAIPLALLIAGSYLFFADGSLNILSMAGMTLAVGMVVDNSVVVLENIRRRRDEGLPLRDACIEGTREMVLAISMATMTTVVVILPLIFMGTENNLRTALSALGMPLSIALLGSLVVALLLLPAGVRALRGLGRPPTPLAASDARLDDPPVRASWWSPLTGLTRFNRALLAVSLRSNRSRLVATLVCGSLLYTMGFPASQLDFNSGDGSPFRGGDVTMNLELPRGFSLRDVDGLVRGYEDFLDDHRDEWRIEHVSSRFGRTSIRFDITLHEELERSEHETYGNLIRASWPRRAGVKTTLRNSGGDPQSGGNAEEDSFRNFVLRLWGPDSEFLAAKAVELQGLLTQWDEIESVEVSSIDDNQEVIVEVDRDRAQDFRVSPDTLERTMSAGLRGRELTRFEEVGREVRLIAQFDAERNPTLWDLKETKIWSETGAFQRLEDVSAIRFRQALGSIHREDGKTHVTVVGRRREGVSARELSKRFADLGTTLGLPRGYTISEASKSGEIAAQLAQLLDAGLLSVVLVFLLMGVLFESVILPLSILVTVPFALFGAFWSLWGFHGSMDIMAGIGMLLLAGVVVNNGIVLLDSIERLRRAGMPRAEAILEGTRIRIRPIVMTAATTIVGLLPMAVFGQSTGSGISYVSMSIAVAGGLAFCTVFTAFAVPLAYTFFDDVSLWLTGVWRQAVPPRAPAEPVRPIEAALPRS